ncbi:MAG: acetyl-CoA carboxylase, biotin carboxyl carrier protein [Acholeplasmataceae bacterium]|nr:acetyl-CoA carboxylase, biotin carboxyl carrier protein [Acholeplasmataceae bacterium]
MKIKEIQSIIKDFEESTLMSLEIEMDGFKLRLSKNKGQNQETEVELNHGIDKILPIEEKNQPKIHANSTPIKSPLVGTFYGASTPKGDPFVEVGQEVKKGQVVCIIEAMKIMNEITSPVSGILKEVVAKTGDVVGFDQILMRIGDK